MKEKLTWLWGNRVWIALAFLFLALLCLAGNLIRLAITQKTENKISTPAHKEVKPSPAASTTATETVKEEKTLWYERHNRWYWALASKEKKTEIPWYKKHSRWYWGLSISGVLFILVIPLYTLRLIKNHAKKGEKEKPKKETVTKPAVVEVVKETKTPTSTVTVLKKGEKSSWGWLRLIEGVLLLSLLICAVIFLSRSRSRNTETNVAPVVTTDTEKPSPLASPLPPGPQEEEVRKFFDKKADSGVLSREDADLMIEHARAESNFNQWEKDGITPLHGRQNPDDIGVMQINRKIWSEFEDDPRYDLDTLEGNLEASLVVLGKQGHYAWKTYKGAPAEAIYAGKKIQIQAPVGTWSKTVNSIPNLRIKTFGNIDIQKADGQVLSATPSSVFDLGRSPTLSFRSRESDTVLVVVTYM